MQPAVIDLRGNPLYLQYWTGEKAHKFFMNTIIFAWDLKGKGKGTQFESEIKAGYKEVTKKGETEVKGYNYKLIVRPT